MFWYLIKQTIVPFIYLLFGTMIALGILMIEDLVWLKVVLLLLNVGLYVVIVGATSFKDGEMGYKALMANDLERMNIIRTGEDRPLKLKEEYAIWKGFVPGLITCIPLVLCLIIHVIINNGGQNMQAAGICNFIYMTFGAFAHVGALEVAPSWSVYVNLLALIVVPLSTGFAYYLGARKIRLQQEMIAEKKRQIYGE
jgi:hypothetical protein